MTVTPATMRVTSNRQSIVQHPRYRPTADCDADYTRPDFRAQREEMAHARAVVPVVREHGTKG